VRNACPRIVRYLSCVCSVAHPHGIATVCCECQRPFFGRLLGCLWLLLDMKMPDVHCCKIEMRAITSDSMLLRISLLGSHSRTGWGRRALRFLEIDSFRDLGFDCYQLFLHYWNVHSFSHT
jgi:hypothetical protein